MSPSFPIYYSNGTSSTFRTDQHVKFWRIFTISDERKTDYDFEKIIYIYNRNKKKQILLYPEYVSKNQSWGLLQVRAIYLPAYFMLFPLSIPIAIAQRQDELMIVYIGCIAARTAVAATPAVDGILVSTIFMMIWMDTYVIISNLIYIIRYPYVTKFVTYNVCCEVLWIINIASFFFWCLPHLAIRVCTLVQYLFPYTYIFIFYLFSIEINKKTK